MTLKHCSCIAAMLALTACASTPLPTDALNAADVAIRRAMASRVGDYTPAELKSAREKIASARSAVARRDMLAASRLAQQAELDADYANTRAEASKAQFSVEDMKNGNEALRQQALRNAVNVAPIALPAPVADTPLNEGY